MFRRLSRGAGTGGRRMVLLYLGALLLAGLFTVDDIGITWDEPNYFGSSYFYLSWFGHVAGQPSDWFASIDRFWEQSHEAPPFFKLYAGLFAGLGALVFGADDLDLLGNVYRMASYVLFLVSVYVVFGFVEREFGRVAAWGTALTMPMIPVLFGFARLGQLDGAVASMAVISSVALFRLVGDDTVSWRRVFWTGVLLGLAFATKITVFPVLAAALLWGLILHRRIPVVLRLCGTCAVGAVVFFAMWPWLWPSPVSRTLEFLTWAGGLQDERFTYYLGQLWAGAPFHYPPVALVVFVPLVVAIAGIAGASRLLRNAGDPASAWLLLNLALVIAVAASGLTPVYGGPRQFLAAFPFWAIFAGVGFAWAVARVRVRPFVAGVVYVGLALPGILWTGTQNSLEYYGEAVGLIPGANSLGFETTYLADTYGPAVEWVNENAPRGATVYVQAGTYPVAESYRRTGRLREDLRPAYLTPIANDRFTNDVTPRDGSYFLFMPRQSIYTEQMISLEKQDPLYEYAKGGVPLVKVYSGDDVARTLDIEGTPDVRRVGWLNAAVVGVGVAGLVFLVYRGSRRTEKQEHEHGK